MKQRAYVLVALGISLSACGDLQRLLTEAAQQPQHGGGGHHSPRPTADAGTGPVEPEPEPAACGAVIGVDELYADVRADLNRLDVEDRRFARYVTLAPEFNAGVCGAELDVGRVALREVLNVTSTSAAPVQPVAIDESALTYRFDLRSPGWDRALRVAGADFSDGWEAVIASSPFAIEHTGPDAARVQAATGSSVPLFALAAFADVVTRNELYSALIGVPASSEALFEQLGVDSAASVANGTALRAVTSKSRISRQDRILERYALGVRSGFLWSAQDFGEWGGLAFEQPLDAVGDARAVSYSLPNGLSAFALFDAAGTRVDSSDVLLDTTQNDFRARTAQSCLNCHASGVLSFEDELRPLVEANPERYSPEVVAAVRRLYPAPAELATLLAADAQLQRAAQIRAGLPTTQGSRAARLSLLFQEDLGVAELAGELLVSREDLLARLPELPPALQRQPVDRDDFTAVYLEAACRVQTGRQRPRRCDGR